MMVLTFGGGASVNEGQAEASLNSGLDSASCGLVQAPGSTSGMKMQVNI